MVMMMMMMTMMMMMMMMMMEMMMMMMMMHDDDDDDDDDEDDDDDGMMSRCRSSSLSLSPPLRLNVLVVAADAADVVARLLRDVRLLQMQQQQVAIRCCCCLICGSGLFNRVSSAQISSLSLCLAPLSHTLAASPSSCCRVCLSRRISSSSVVRA
jgi:hypothetical protein